MTRRLRNRRWNKLRLSSGALRGHHKPARYAISYVGTKITLDQMQARVDSRCAAGRCDHLTLVDIEHARIYLYGGKPVGKFIRVTPVGSGSFSIEQPGGSEYEHA